MKLKQMFSQVERLIQRIPTWLFVAGEVVVLALIALWLETEAIRSFRDAVKVLFEHAESIAIVSAVILFFKEAPGRKAQKHYEAWQVVDRAATVPTSYARIQALQDLNEDRVSLRGIHLSGAHLQEIHLPGAALIGADLHGADLVRANLRGANLSRADLGCAILIDADLSRSNLSVANLTHAILGIADLSEADLSDADLSEANLCAADLDRALLHDVNFSGADLSGADLSGADLSGADLRQAKNLTTVQIKAARNWKCALYDEAVWQDLLRSSL